MVWEDGQARPTSENAGKFEPLSLADLAAQASATGGPIGAGVALNTTGAEGGFATHICDVEVDPDTGRAWVTRYTSVQDVGRAIHPSYVEGQMQGGAAQGIGWALSEEYIYDRNGQVDNPSPVEGMRQAVKLLLALGYSDDEAHTMVATNPAKLIGLKSA